jgi:hypothetical protein
LNKELTCRILDIDFEKEVLDLVEEDSNKSEKLLAHKDYNF